MRLFLDLSMGAAGDMLMSALYELLPDQRAFESKMAGLNLPGVTYEYGASTKCGITGTHITVMVDGVVEQSEDVHDHSHDHSHDHEHHHDSGHHHHHGTRYSYDEIIEIVQKLGLPDNVEKDALGVYRLLGEAEAAVHGVTLSDLHLHEVGALDAVADIVGCCLLFNMLGVSDVLASPVHVGSGFVRCEHGVLPVPAPATAEILKGVPIYGGRIKGELCTPTGAALLRHFVTRFGDMPPMTVCKIGYGMGTKDFPAANCLRAFYCEDDVTDGGGGDEVFELSCNLDDMSPEAVAAAFDLLLENGALDVFSTPILMKKNRPAVMLSCLCTADKRERLSQLMLEHTTTLGVRVKPCRRDILVRTVETIATEYGAIRVKRAHGFGTVKHKPEYDDVLAAAKQHGVPFATVYQATLAAL